MRIEAPRQSGFRPVADLAGALDVTPAAVYRADDLGYLGGTIRAGRSRKITLAAFEYHSRFGYGPSVPRAGTPEAGAHAAEASRRGTDAAA